jgi:hypothetical protein
MKDLAKIGQPRRETSDTGASNTPTTREAQRVALLRNRGARVLASTEELLVAYRAGTLLVIWTTSFQNILHEAIFCCGYQ